MTANELSWLIVGGWLGALLCSCCWRVHLERKLARARRRFTSYAAQAIEQHRTALAHGPVPTAFQGAEGITRLAVLCAPMRDDLGETHVAFVVDGYVREVDGHTLFDAGTEGGWVPLFKRVYALGAGDHPRTLAGCRARLDLHILDVRPEDIE